MPITDPEARRAYQREWLAKRRREWIEENGPCAECGSDEDLEVDHIDRHSKVAPISTIWSWSRERREAELTKCQVLCSDCHREKSVKEMDYPERRCGTPTMYRHGCRCDRCRHAASEAKQAWREARRAASLPVS